MGYRELDPSGDAVVEALLSRLRSAVKGWGRRWGCVVNADVLGDIEQEARIALWKSQPRWEPLPAKEQEAYATQCVRRAAARVLRRELKHQRHTLFIADLSAPDSSAVELRETGGHEPPGLSSPQDVLACLDDPLLHDAFSALTAGEQMVVFLAVIMDVSDSEMAAALHLTPAAATKRRQRALAKMRKFIEQAGAGERFRRLPRLRP